MKNASRVNLIFIISIIVAILGIVALFDMRAMIALIMYGGLFAVNGSIALASAVLLCVAGIVGILFARRREKSGVLFLFGILLVAVALGNTVIRVVLTEFSPMALVSMIFPILYFIAAVLNKRSIGA